MKKAILIALPGILTFVSVVVVCTGAELAYHYAYGANFGGSGLFIGVIFGALLSFIPFVVAGDTFGDL